ncbi:MAG: hypothetical protein JJU24_08290 [Natronohydrobacter sp.]|nr:hypothetical protein [Natronohydrobacter sp.]
MYESQHGENRQRQVPMPMTGCLITLKSASWSQADHKLCMCRAKQMRMANPARSHPAPDRIAWAELLRARNF